MGLPRPFLRFIAREHRRRPFVGPVLTLGRQCVYVTFDEAAAMLREEGLIPCEVPPSVPRLSTIPSWQNTPQAGYTSDQAFFRMLSCDQVAAMDYSAFEGAEFVADLNKPVPQEHHGRYDLIVDTGTLEHLFDVPQALENLSRMLRVGGRVIHISPANNYCNHGFYQISPTLFADFYRQNKFSDVRVFLAEQRSIDDITSPLTVYEVDSQPVLITSPRKLFSIAVAERREESTADQIPLQSFYVQTYGGDSAGNNSDKPLALAARIKRLLPVGLKTWLRKVVPGFHPQRRPWGLKLWGRLE